MEQCQALWYLFDFSTREVGSTDIVLGHSLLELTNKKFKEKQALFNFSDRSGIWDFDDTVIVLY